MMIAVANSIRPNVPVLPATTRRIVLTGFMGAGKSTIGRLLAETFGWAFSDLDRHLEDRTGRSIPDLFARFGEAQFRRMESTALASALAATSTVLALGGGTLEVHTNRLLLEQTPGTLTVFLDAPFPVLFDRCVLQGIARPVLHDPVAAEARYLARLPIYRRLANLTQQTACLNASETMESLLAALRTFGERSAQPANLQESGRPRR